MPNECGRGKGMKNVCEEMTKMTDMKLELWKRKGMTDRKEARKRGRWTANHELCQQQLLVR